MPSNFSPEHAGLCPPKDMYMNTPRSFIHNSPKLQTTHVFTRSRTDKLHHIYTMEYYTTMKKNEVWLFTTTWVNLIDKMISRKPFMRIHSVGLCLYEFEEQVKQIKGDSSKKSGYPWEESQLRRGTGKLLVTDIFYILIHMVITWYKYILKLIQLYT